ncbi:hypothetical protein F5X68DRAFT_243461 [Plectosphaerella plurivora]|uniref:Uncharacterized protein n=1 Tax=Plectosphaerella plurivora TaxID=936078 RepID=A0A9P8VJE2_9PEZI|nr:hypothetical protein F5X68DRAFT_243461 [Plectosphaerella plurivora]
MLQRSLASTAQWLSPAALALVLLALLLSRTRVGHQAFANGSLSADSGSVAACLSHIQFFFFLGALTLQFPGFIRPITSSSSWSTLMFPGGPIMGDSLYLGVSDGIYQVNGTFGGTAGLELVSQITGAPATTWNWINIISLACMLLASLMLIFQLGRKVPWTRRVFDSKTMQRIRGTESHGVRGTLYTVSRLFFSYFMTPVVAWTSYQLTLGSLLPSPSGGVCVRLQLDSSGTSSWMPDSSVRMLQEFLVPRTSLLLPSSSSCIFEGVP